MNRPRKLTLRGEALRTLAAPELVQVGGGTQNNSNVTCSDECVRQTIGGYTHHVSEVTRCKINTL